MPPAKVKQNCHKARHTFDIYFSSVWVMSSDPRHELGRRGEQAAVEHLLRRGFDIVERNYRTRWGELDIVAYDGSSLIFCEVKARRMPARGGYRRAPASRSTRSTAPSARSCAKWPAAG